MSTLRELIEDELEPAFIADTTPNYARGIIKQVRNALDELERYAALGRKVCEMQMDTGIVRTEYGACEWQMIVCENICFDYKLLSSHTTPFEAMGIDEVKHE